MTTVTNLSQINSEGTFRVTSKNLTIQIDKAEDGYYASIKTDQSNLFWIFTNDSASNVYTVKRLTTLLNRINKLY
jgi:hypothetical protein